MSYCSIGHVALDLIDKEKSPGGSVLFGAHLAHHMGQKTSAVTSSSVDFPYAEYSDIEWSIEFAPQTTTYKHEYINGMRSSSLLKKADQITEKSIGKAIRNNDIIMLGPIVDEIAPDLIKLFSTQWVGLTPQGWFRSFDANGNLISIKSKFRELPKKIKLIVVSEDDLQSDPESWDWIRQYAEIAVMTMGKEGYILSMEGDEKKYAPMEVIKEINPTGCGDIFSTGLLILLSRGIGPEQACAWAGHAAGLASSRQSLDESIQIAARFLKSKF